MKDRTTPVKTAKTSLTIAPEARSKKAPKAKTAQAKAAPTPKVGPLEGVRIRAEVLTYKPDLHRKARHNRYWWRILWGACISAYAASVAKADRRVVARGMSSNHAATRTKLSAVAVRMCCKRVLA
jgi:hypothetical protein